MDKNVKTAPASPIRANGASTSCSRVTSSSMMIGGVDAVGRGADVRLSLFIEIGDREHRAGPMTRSSDAPSDRLIIGDADDQCPLVRRDHSWPSHCAMCPSYR